MPSKPIKKSKKQVTENRRIRLVAIASIAALIIFGGIIPVTAMQFENQNSFCAPCHTEGEVTFFDRASAASPVDLASIHDIKGQARCIDCHTGPGIIGR
jgi:nitrate/TMAO reductase-like tetraheme cytochrome c subunit